MRAVRALVGGHPSERRLQLIADKYLAGEDLSASEMRVLRQDWSERFRRGIRDEGYGRRKIIRIPRDEEGCLDWCFPMPKTESGWQELAEGLGVPAAELKKLDAKSP